MAAQSIYVEKDISFRITQNLHHKMVLNFIFTLSLLHVDTPVIPNLLQPDYTNNCTNMQFLSILCTFCPLVCHNHLKGIKQGHHKRV